MRKIYFISDRESQFFPHSAVSKAHTHVCTCLSVMILEPAMPLGDL